jgi:hypothetical protein
LSNEE